MMGGLPCAKAAINQRTMALMSGMEEALANPYTASVIGYEKVEHLTDCLIEADIVAINGGTLTQGYRYVADELIAAGVLDKRLWEV